MTSAVLWILIVLTCLASAACLYVVWRRTSAVAAWKRVLLVALRAAALAALVLMFVNPLSTRVAQEVRAPRVVVLTDCSASMSITDAPAGVERLAWCRRLVRAEGRLGQALIGADVREMLFADEVRAGDSGESAAADGPATDIGAGIVAAVRSEAAGPPDAVVLLSDGRSNRGADAGKVVQNARVARTPIYSIGVAANRARPMRGSRV